MTSTRSSPWRPARQVLGQTMVNLATAIRQLAADGLARGGTIGTIRVWDDPQAATFDIHTPTPIDDLLAGRHPPRRDPARDDPLLWTNQICDSSSCDPPHPGPPSASTPGSSNQPPPDHDGAQGRPPTSPDRTRGASNAASGQPRDPIPTGLSAAANQCECPACQMAPNCCGPSSRTIR